MKQSAALILMFFLAACGKLSGTTVEQALETSWRDDRATMATVAHIDLPGAKPGAMRGTARSLQAARGLTEAYAGSAVGDLAGQAAGAIGDIATDFGIVGAKDITLAMKLANAKNWDVSNLEILSQRKSGEDYVVDMRYDLAVELDGKMVQIARDVNHLSRLQKVNGEWGIAGTL